MPSFPSIHSWYECYAARTSWLGPISSRLTVRPLPCSKGRPYPNLVCINWFLAYRGLHFTLNVSGRRPESCWTLCPSYGSLYLTFISDPRSVDPLSLQTCLSISGASVIVSLAGYTQASLPGNFTLIVFSERGPSSCTTTLASVASVGALNLLGAFSMVSNFLPKCNSFWTPGLYRH